MEKENRVIVGALVLSLAVITVSTVMGQIAIVKNSRKVSKEKSEAFTRLKFLSAKLGEMIEGKA